MPARAERITYPEAAFRALRRFQSQDVLRELKNIDLVRPRFFLVRRVQLRIGLTNKIWHFESPCPRFSSTIECYRIEHRGQFPDRENGANDPSHLGPAHFWDKIFGLERPWNDRVGLWCKVREGTREIIIGSDPARFFVTALFGAKGWIGVGLDEASDWAEVEAFVRRSYRLIAPKRLAKLVA